ncbi:hypothetical protein B0I37DRAFT_301525 [Chaetomium sp. MPI-CAGE-AT-0009]|nr:hypothetical protein B0I37DRAFT_301525 [Chaetomium sp. MPI-CAGE-AT-0009]
MPPPTKRTYAATSLHNNTSTPSKRQRRAEVVVLSSDSESDAFEIDQRYHPIVLDDDSEEEYKDEGDYQSGYDDGSEEEEDNDGPQEPQGSQYYRSRSLIEQLQKDAFDDFKADICLELDCLPESIETATTLSKPGASDSAADPSPVENNHAQGLRDVLREWVKQDKASRRTNHLYYRLDHIYSDDQFPPEPLLGRDAVVVETLNQMAGELHLEIFLALLDREDRAPTPDYLVRSLVDQQGHELISYIPVDDNLVQTKVPSSNACASGSEVAVMLAPRDSVVDFLMRHTAAPSAPTLCSSQIKLLESVAKYFTARILGSSSRDRLSPVFREFCVTVWQLDEAKGLSVLSDLVVHDLLQAVVHMEDWDFLEQAACRLGKRPPPGFAGAVDASQLANIISQLLADGADSVVASFAFKVVADVGLIPRQEFTSFWIPFLGHLIKVLEEQSVPLSTSRYRHLFAAILETYLARFVGALPLTWMPKNKEVDCCCGLCTLFRRFLINNVSAASFRSVSQWDIRHLNTYLIPHAYKNNRCVFGMEDGSLVVRKAEEVDVQSRKSWMDNNKKASINIRKLDGPALRKILGDDYPRLRNFRSVQMPRRCSPVPIDSLGDPRYQASVLRPHQTPVSTAPTAPTAPPGSAHRPLGRSRPTNPQDRLPSTNSPLPAAPARYVRTDWEVIPRDWASLMLKERESYISRVEGVREALQTQTHPLLAGYRLNPAAFSPRFTPKADREVIPRDWDSLTLKERESYISRVEASNDRLPSSTPTASPHKTRFPSRSTPFRSPPSSVGKRATSGSSSKGAKPSVSVSASRTATAMQPSSPSPRVFGPVSSGRLNSVPTSRSDSKVKTGVVKIKTEAVPPASSSRGAKKRVIEVIDLTGDD